MKLQKTPIYEADTKPLYMLNADKAAKKAFLKHILDEEHFQHIETLAKYDIMSIINNQEGLNKILKDKSKERDLKFYSIFCNDAETLLECLSPTERKRDHGVDIEIKDEIAREISYRNNFNGKVEKIKELRKLQDHYNDPKTGQYVKNQIKVEIRELLLPLLTNEQRDKKKDNEIGKIIGDKTTETLTTSLIEKLLNYLEKNYPNQLEVDPTKILINYLNKHEKHRKQIIKYMLPSDIRLGDEKDALDIFSKYKLNFLIEHKDKIANEIRLLQESDAPTLKEITNALSNVAKHSYIKDRQELCQDLSEELIKQQDNPLLNKKEKTQAGSLSQLIDRTFKHQDLKALKEIFDNNKDTFNSLKKELNQPNNILYKVKKHILETKYNNHLDDTKHQAIKGELNNDPPSDAFKKLFIEKFNIYNIEKKGIDKILKSIEKELKSYAFKVQKDSNTQTQARS